MTLFEHIHSWRLRWFHPNRVTFQPVRCHHIMDNPLVQNLSMALLVGLFIAGLLGWHP